MWQMLTPGKIVGGIHLWKIYVTYSEIHEGCHEHMLEMDRFKAVLLMNLWEKVKVSRETTVKKSITVLVYVQTL